MANDSDGFNRWDAAQMLLQRILLRRISDAREALPDGLLDSFGRALTDPDTDKALLAEVLTLPSESYLGIRWKRWMWMPSILAGGAETAFGT